MCCIVLQSSSVYYHIGGRAGFLQTSPPLTVVRENTLYQHLSLTSSCLQDTRKYEPFDRIFPCAQRARIRSSFPFPLTSYDKKKETEICGNPFIFCSKVIGLASRDSATHLMGLAGSQRIVSQKPPSSQACRFSWVKFRFQTRPPT